MKKSEIFKKKNLMQIALQNGYGFVVSKKKVTGYKNGVICVKSFEDVTSVFSTLNENTEQGITCYTGNPYRIEFLDTEMMKNWDKLFVYLFDSEGAFFLCADRKQLEDVGAFCVFADVFTIEEMRKNVLNVAPLWGEQLYETILRLENTERKKLMLTDKGER